MSNGIDPNDLRQLRGETRETLGATFDERKKLERKSKLHADGRSNKQAEPVMHLNVALPPSLKDRIVRACRARDVRIADFAREWLERGVGELEK